jgi:hypothetical protein
VSKQHKVIATQLLRQSANDDKAQAKMSSTISHQKETKRIKLIAMRSTGNGWKAQFGKMMTI